jgi:hypothetical protein
MTASPPLLRDMYNSSRAMGTNAIVSDAMFEIEGFESMALRVPQFPTPVLTTSGEIEVPTPLGGGMFLPQQLKVHQQGSITLTEPVANYVSVEFLKFIVDHNQSFNAKLHEREQGQIFRTYSLYDCTFWKLNPSEFSYTDRSQVLKFSGVFRFLYFGDVVCRDR